LCCGWCQLAAETAARDAQEEVEKRTMAAEETARKKAAVAEKKGKGGKDLSPTPKKGKGKETSSSPVPLTGVTELKWHNGPDRAIGPVSMSVCVFVCVK